MPLMLLLVALASAVLATPAEASRWGWPVSGRSLAERFHFDARRPFAPGGSRGVTFAATPGADVRAVCAGRIAFAGDLPAMGKGVTIRCGRLAATEIGVADLAVRRGGHVRRGDRLGVLAAGGMLHLGARIAAQARGYRDPLALLGDGRGPLGHPLGTAPRGRGLRPLAAPIPARRPGPEPLGVSPLMLAATWLGLGLFAGAIGAGIGVRTVRRSRRVEASARAGLPGTR